MISIHVSHSESVDIAVEDSGETIPEDLRQKVFERFLESMPPARGKQEEADLAWPLRNGRLRPTEAASGLGPGKVEVIAS